MKIIFATTNKRKIEDAKKVIDHEGLDIEILSLNDIGFNEEIEENGKTLEENSIIKAKAIKDFCNKNNINYTILSDDSGLFIKALNNEPGIFTARYADDEIKKDPTLPKYECVNKVLRKLDGVVDRSAQYRCVITCITEDNEYMTVNGITNGDITNEIIDEISYPFFYLVFKPVGSNQTMNKFNDEELYDTYRFVALRSLLKRLENKQEKKLRVE